MSQEKPILGYWKIRGVGHPIRFLLHYLEVDYEEKYYDDSKSEEWYAEKEKLGLVLPNVPYFFDRGNKITESRAIIKYLCRTRKPELLGKTLEVQTKIDMLDYFIYDLLEIGLVPAAYYYTEERRKKWVEEDEPRKLRYLTDFIGDNQWATGNDITFVDFVTYEVLFFFKVYNPKCLDKFPKLQAYMDQFENLPAIRKFMDSETFFNGPCFLGFCTYKM